MFPDTVGIVAMSARLTDVDAPVREELNTGSTCAVTVISSCTAIGCTEKTRSVPTPRLTMMSTCVSGANAVPPAPTYATVTLYGPPTLMPGIENRPSARVTASYVVPDGSWIAITLAPATGSCWVLVTMPVTAPVVTPCASACSAGHSSVHTAKRVTNPRIYVIAFSPQNLRVGWETNSGVKRIRAM